MQPIVIRLLDLRRLGPFDREYLEEERDRRRGRSEAYLGDRVEGYSEVEDGNFAYPRR